MRSAARRTGHVVGARCPEGVAAALLGKQLGASGMVDRCGGVVPGQLDQGHLTYGGWFPAAPGGHRSHIVRVR